MYRDSNFNLAIIKIEDFDYNVSNVSILFVLTLVIIHDSLQNEFNNNLDENVSLYQILCTMR